MNKVDNLVITQIIKFALKGSLRVGLELRLVCRKFDTCFRNYIAHECCYCNRAEKLLMMRECPECDTRWCRECAWTRGLIDYFPMNEDEEWLCWSCCSLKALD